MRIYYDTEFIDDGKTIELISIGAVAENGEEFYRINEDLSLIRLARHSWLMDNVVPSLPVCTVRPGILEWDDTHTDFNLIKPRDDIRDELADFLLYKCNAYKDEPELWAWYGAYDHVALAQLWGPMSMLPGFVPQYTNDLKQEVTRREKLGNKRLRFNLPKMEDGTFHNALHDARLLKLRYAWVMDQ